MGRGSARRRGPFRGGRSMHAGELSKSETLVQPVRELWCEGCGYGIVVRREPPECPMCRQANWRERPRSGRYN
jgi:rubrerythrin